MERNSLNKMKDSEVDDRRLADNSNKAKESLDYSTSYYGGDLLGGFAWPPRTYTCSFCRREFRSAQALGGHMNVHRRDRARLRHSPTWDDQIFNINPNPRSSSLSPSRLPPFAYTFPCMRTPSLSSFSSSASPASSSEMKIPNMMGTPFDPSSSMDGTSAGTMKALGFMKEDECKILKKGENKVMLDLEIGLCRDLNEDLDLELRLGYS